MKAWKIILGVVLIAAAVLLILEAVGVIDPVSSVVGEITFWQAFGGIAVATVIVSLLSWRRLWMVFVPLGFLFMIFERNIAHVCNIEGGDIINNWLVFGCSLLVSVGFMFLSSGKRKRKKHLKTRASTNKMGISTIYVDCDEFGNSELVKNIENRCGAIEVHFDNAERYLGGATLCIENYLGAIEINVPKGWKVNCDGVNLTLGAIDFPSKAEQTDGPTLTIEGNVHLGAVDVNRV